MSLESLQKEGNYEQMAKQVSCNATVTGRRKPVYINYTKEGRFKDKPAEEEETTYGNTKNI